MQTEFLFSNTKTETGSSKGTTDNIRAIETLTLRNVGAYFYDPRLIRLNVGGTIGLTQRRQTTSGLTSTTDTQRGNVRGYDLSAHILSGQAISLGLFAHRTQDFLDSTLSGETEVTAESRGVNFNANQLYIPAQVSFQQVLVDQESRIADVVTRQEQRDNIISYRGQRGWIDSEIDLSYRFVDHVDEVIPTSSFRSHEGRFRFGLDFGSELNYHFNSRFNVFARSGSLPVRNWTASEDLAIDHTERFSTRYGYSFALSESEGVDPTVNQTGSVTAVHRLYQNLTTTVGADVKFNRPANGRINEYTGRLDLGYTKRLPAKGVLNAGLGGSYTYTDQRFDSTETFVPQESHTATTPVASPIELDNRFVIESSVVVTKVALGPLPVGCVPSPVPQLLTEGVDYTLRTIGDITEIVPLSCSPTNPGINPGDTIAVDYTFTVSASATYATTNRRVGLSVDYGWIRPFFRHDQMNQNLLSGTDGTFLNDQRTDTLGVELRYDRPGLNTNLTAEAQKLSSDQQSYISLQANQYLGYAILPELRLVLRGNERFIDFSDPVERQTLTLGVGTTLRYTLNASLSAEASAEVLNSQDTLSEDETRIQTTLGARWAFRSVEVIPRLRFLNRSRGDTVTNEFQFGLRLVRRF